MWGGGSLAGGVAWYTTNTFGPGVDVGGSTAIAANRDGSSKLGLRWKGDGIAVQAPVDEAYVVRVLDAAGKVWATFSARGSGEFALPASALGHGLRWVEARASGGQRWISSVGVP